MTTSSTAAALPLFYRASEAVTAARFASSRLLTGDYGFAAQAPYVPLVIGEFASASRDYPILFAETTSVTPVALLGIEETNLFVENGLWAPDRHVPAYVRRYPFASAPIGESGRFALAIDASSDLLSETGVGDPLFADGAPTRLTIEAFAFCEAFRDSAAATQAFCEAISDAGLLVERRADVTLPSGDRRTVEGFRLVDPDALAALDDALIGAWHRNGWLALIHSHLASMDRFAGLIARSAMRAAPQASHMEDRNA